MSEANERLNTPISTKELERRWSLVRRAMEARKIDVLVMQQNNDFMGGYVKYFTDLPATNGYPMAVVFPRDEGMSVVGQGPFNLDRELPPEGDGVRRGVTRTDADGAELRLGALHPLLRCGTGREGARALFRRDHRPRRHRLDAACHGRASEAR
jgi:hypothetical protein